MKRYNPKELEPRWQKVWEDSKIYQTGESDNKPKRYVLEYFPYPSGAAMHVGHVRNYAIGDAIARHARMSGFNVLHPMGWDSFGLPAENYAIKNNISPQQAIADNTGKFKKQLTQMGFSYDWSREINSSDPSYYRWTQWFFQLLYKRGLAYQKDSPQWWCDTDKTVLANEQVEDGKCWRCGNEVSKKPLKQWFFRITDYAERLSDDLDKVDWTEAIKTMQRNWIGKSDGAEVEFTIGGEQLVAKDTLKFSPKLTEAILKSDKSVTYRFEPKNLQVGDIAKLATRFSANETRSFAYARITSVETVSLKDIFNDLAGHEKYSSTDEKLNDYINYYGDQVTLDSEFTVYTFEKIADIITVFTTRPDTLYGATFMVLAPEHELVEYITTDEQKSAVEAYRKQAAAKSDVERQENRDKTGVFTGAYAINPVNEQPIPIWIADYVLTGYGTGAIMAVPAHDERDFEFAEKFDLPVVRVIKNEASDEDCSSEEGVMINSGRYDGATSADARELLTADLEKSGQGKAVTNFKIRDWLISRQRYWGAPIPVVHCDKDGVVLVPESELPVELPAVKSYQPTGEGTSVLAGVSDWVNVECPTCGGPAKRETDTMDGFACSSWYFLRFADPNNHDAPFDKAKADQWLPVDDYIGGAEHAVMHLLYARMWTKVMFDAGLIDFDEPFMALRNQGMILAPDGRKMSKSWGNTITPDDIIEQGYGADSIRVMELFIGPWDQSANWSTEGLGGCFRFLQRVWTLVGEYLDDRDERANDAAELALRRATNRAIKRVTEDLADMGFNTAIAGLMEYVNTLYKIKAEHGYGSRAEWRTSLEQLQKLLAPFAPHITEELWQMLGNEKSVHLADWPSFDEQYLQEDQITLAVQVNGKLRGEITVPSGSDQPSVESVAKSEPKVAAHLDGHEIVKVIYVEGRLVNFVVR